MARTVPQLSVSSGIAADHALRSLQQRPARDAGKCRRVVRPRRGFLRGKAGTSRSAGPHPFPHGSQFMSSSRAFRHAGALPAALLSLASLAGIAGNANAQADFASAIGEQKTAVILVNFQDDTSQPITPAAANALVFGEVSDFYWEASYEKAFLSGDTYGWFTVAAVSAATCDTQAIAREANAAAAAAGVDLSGYSHVVYQFPYRSVCGWSGANDRGDRGENRVFVNGARTFKVIAHELGHRFGLFHS